MGGGGEGIGGETGVNMTTLTFTLRPAQREDVAAIHGMVRELAEYEKLTHLVTGSAADLERELFGAQPVIEALIAQCNGVPAAFALYFHNYSTFLARRGLYLEDVYVKPAFRRRGIGRALLTRLAQIAVERNCGRFEWSVLDWNEPDRKSTRLNSSHVSESRMPSSA